MTDRSPGEKTSLRQALLITAGTICVVLAVFGIVLPVLPTTPFLLLAAICYERSSPRFHNWLLTNRWFGLYIKNYREGRGIPLRQKVVTLVILWLTIAAGIVFMRSSWWISLLLAAVAIGVTIHIARIKTAGTVVNADETAS
jgi:uncharacterized membrane protein YbaN (DUF454 family)